MLRARDGGQLLRSEADYQLHVLYLWYEHQPLRALELLAGLRERYPRNPHFPQVIAEIQDIYLHDDTASLRAWQAMLAAAAGGRLAATDMAEARARLGIAVQLDRLFETDAALEHLQAVINAAPAAPFGAVAQAHLLLAQALDRLGARQKRSRAIEGHRGRRQPRPAEASQTRRAPVCATRRMPIPRAPIGCRSKDGVRSSEARSRRQPAARRSRWPCGRMTGHEVSAGAPADCAEQPIDGSDAARADPRRSDRAAPTFLASACVDAAEIHEQLGARARAIELYTRAAATFGADERSKDTARRALARLSSSRTAPRE